MRSAGRKFILHRYPFVNVNSTSTLPHTTSNVSGQYPTPMLTASWATYYEAFTGQTGIDLSYTSRNSRSTYTNVKLRRYDSISWSSRIRVPVAQETWQWRCYSWPQGCALEAGGTRATAVSLIKLFWRGSAPNNLSSLPEPWILVFGPHGSLHTRDSMLTCPGTLVGAYLEA